MIFRVPGSHLRAKRLQCVVPRGQFRIFIEQRPEEWARDVGVKGKLFSFDAPLDQFFRRAFGLLY